MISVRYYLLLFYVYAILGWVMEVLVGLIRNKKIVNRGFMIGPYCPIYGVGGIIITIFLQQYTNSPLVLFCVAIVICGLLEYLTSFLMEKLFKARWWDYSKRKFNINGRICLETIIPFGLLGCFIMYVTNPLLFNLLNNMPDRVYNVICISFITIFILDFIISFFVISRLKNTVKQVNTSEISDNTEEITRKVKEILKSNSIFDRRLIEAFPKISIDKVKQKIKEKTDQVKENVIRAKEDATEKIKESAEKVKNNTIKIKDDAAEKIRDGANKVKKTTQRVKKDASKKIKNRSDKINVLRNNKKN